MFQIKSIRLYFLSLFKLISINTKKLYYKSNHYNSRIHEEAASRINYFPSSFLLNSLLLNNNETYKIPKLVFEEIWDHKGFFVEASYQLPPDVRDHLSPQKKCRTTL